MAVCTEARPMQVTYKVKQRRGRRLRDTSWSRTTNACVDRWHEWYVFHNSRWMKLHRDELGHYYIITN